MSTLSLGQFRSRNLLPLDSKMLCFRIVLGLLLCSSLFLSASCQTISKVSSLRSESRDGANVSSTQPSMSSTTMVNDIRKMLEDYVAYLARLPDLNHGVSHSANTRSSRNLDLISTAESEQVNSPVILTKTDRESFDSSTIKTKEIADKGEVEEQTINPERNKYLLEIPADGNLNLNLSDEELSAFIDNVLGSSTNYEQGVTTEATPESTSEPDGEIVENSTTEQGETESEDSSTKPATIMEAFNQLKKEFEAIKNLDLSRAKIQETNQEENAFNSINSSIWGQNEQESTTFVSTTTTAPTPTTTITTTENPAEILSQISKLFNETKANLTNLSMDKNLYSDGRFYTDDPEYFTESYSTESLTSAPATTTVMPKSTNEEKIIDRLRSSNDPTMSNNFNQKFHEMDDTELLRELKRTKDLIRMQIQKLKKMENSVDFFKSDNSGDANGDQTEPTTEVVSQTTTTTALPSQTVSGKIQASQSKPTTITATTANVAVNTAPMDIMLTTTTTQTPLDGEGRTTNNNIPTMTTLADLSVESNDSNEKEDDEEEEEEVSPNWISTTQPNNEQRGTTTESNVVLLIDPGNNANKSTNSRISIIAGSGSKNDSNESTIISQDSVSALTGKPGPKVSGKSVTKTDSVGFNDDILRVKDTPMNRANDHSAISTTATNEAEKNVTTFSEGSHLDLAALNNSSSHSENNSSANLHNDDHDGGPSSKNNKTTAAESDTETMILTHVPKITIIHKIMKPSGGRNSTDSEEEYKDALRKHKDLIKSTMSSISLYPALFKRYKINNNNRVNSVGEIYLLPNFTSLAANAGVNSESSNYVQIDNRFLPVLPDDSVDNYTDSNSANLTETFVVHKIKSNKQKLVKLAHKTNRNKFNGQGVRHKIAKNGSRSKQNNLSYRKYLHNFPNKPNAENILQLYRPRFVSRKRYKKVRIPSEHRLRKNSPIKISAHNGTSSQHIVAYPNGSPILITFGAKSSPRTNTTAQQARFTRKITGQQAAKNFKIFCTYDAHRSLSSLSNDSGGRFFDITQLEQNPAILQYCTHLVYAFANVNMNGEIVAGESGGMRNDMLKDQNEQNSQATLSRLQSLKQRFPHLRVLAAVGGWNTPPQLFSLLVATAKLRDRLSQNIHKFVLDFDLDGAIVSWFYPVFGSKTGLDNSRSTRSTQIGQTLFQLDDKQNLVKLIRTLKAKFESIPHKALEIGLMSPPFEELIERGYDVTKLSELLDHYIVMSYDYYGSWEDRVHHFAPLYPISNHSLNERDQKLNINYTIDYLLNSKHIPSSKTLLGVAFYGRSFTLENASIAQSGAPAIGPGIAGPITNKPGLLSFNELCELYLGQPTVRLIEDQHRITASLQLFDQWVGFDDELSLYLKTKYAIANRLSGVFVWAINHDDYRNRCGWGRFPLLKAVHKAVEHCATLKEQCS